MITVHHLNNSRSHRVLWLLEELALPYQLVVHQRDPRTLRAPPALRAIHPLGKAPVIVDEGRVIAESGAIIEYILTRYGEGRLAPPAGSEDGLRFTHWLHHAEGSAMPPLLLKLIFRDLPGRVPFPIRPLARGIAAATQRVLVDPQLSLHADYWEGELAKRPWFAGDAFTAADIQMSYPLEAFAVRAGMVDAYPNIRSFLAKIRARPAHQRAIERGGPLAPP
ncbi:glutathione S-transferase [Nitrospirillum sp. BR 11828]|uniref:glutathione S-transferase family protein n=1 Tax=Nitrospirillum sp. BR 11828 TaxID=3104325 RepID=UPI002ACA8D28|nr:glutathione S-transferase [Nitrospirillum sp. BR 11828]MDZ5646225.1 glutathione S-transferase [Nitrospirillum sp. BR 11828]